MTDAEQQFDTAIIGAGVSGLYTAWRLTNDPNYANSRIAVFEGSNRAGGRLWSVSLEDETAIPAELGGMFFSDSQPLVYQLSTTVLGLDIQPISPRPDFAYVRGDRFKIADMGTSEDLPYHLAPKEQDKPYHELLTLALHRLIPNLDDLWPFNDKANIATTIKALRDLKIEGRPLYRWGFWNLLAKSLSNEAFLCLRDLVSSYSMFNNWNAYDAILSLLEELHGNWYRLANGYDRLTDSLEKALEEEGVPVYKNHWIRRISDSAGGSLRLESSNAAALPALRADRVVLAIPKAAITAMDAESSIFSNGQVLENLCATEGVPAYKIFMTFEEPWWRHVKDGPGKVDPNSFAASHTDLPMRQCYYLGTDPETGDGLLLASFGDAAATPFWASLMSETGRQEDLKSDVSGIAREELRRQLSEMHDFQVPEPKNAVFIDWSRPPYGGGWHAWLPGWQSWRVMATLRQPDPDRKFHICGESVCAHQGWVEGALSSAEMMLQEQFGLSKPDWLTSTESLESYKP